MGVELINYDNLNRKIVQRDRDLAALDTVKRVERSTKMHTYQVDKTIISSVRELSREDIDLIVGKITKG